MPPKTKPHKKHGCSWIVRGKPCGLPAADDEQPPLCARHLDEYEADDEGTDEYGDLQDVLQTALKDKRVRGVLDRAAGLFDRFAQVLDRASVTRPPGTPPPHRPPPPRPSVPRENPRDVLHFGPTEVLTAKGVKDRKRALASMIHPDHGGSTEAMARINAAADALLASLK